MKLPYTEHFVAGTMPDYAINAYIALCPLVIPEDATIKVFYSEDGMVSHFTIDRPTPKTFPVQSTPSVLDFVEQQ